jgi:glycosyltransferase involved in cell wall biosynthesis
MKMIIEKSNLFRKPSRHSLDERKSVIFVIQSLARGGAEKNTVHLANEFVQRGIRVTVVLIFDNEELSNELNGEVELIQLGLKRYREAPFPLYKVLKRLTSDKIIINQWPLTCISFMSAFACGKIKKLVMIEHIFLSRGMSTTLVIERMVCKLFHRICKIFSVKFIAVSKGVRDDLIQYYGLRERAISTIYNPAITHVPESLNRKSMPTDLSSPIKILCVGNLKPQKDYQTLLQVIHRMKSMGHTVEVSIAGDGPLRAEIESSIVKLNLSAEVKLLGSVSSLEEYYTETDIYLLTSKWEGFGNTLAEALSYGCRVVSTDCQSGPAEILCYGDHGELAEVGNVEDIITKILISLKKPVDQSRARIRAAEFSAVRVSDRYIEALGLRN